MNNPTTDISFLHLLLLHHLLQSLIHVCWCRKRNTANCSFLIAFFSCSWPWSRLVLAFSYCPPTANLVSPPLTSSHSLIFPTHCLTSFHSLPPLLPPFEAPTKPNKWLSILITTGKVNLETDANPASDYQY